jgi:DNA helicase II / ATP-dependent DNA helicase PcrA
MDDEVEKPVEEEYLPLTREQEELAYASPDAHLLVLAPPGTGKTHIVVARIEYLIVEEMLDPHELVVLCFTRAAVGEIINRVTQLIKDKRMHDDLRFVAVRTFDSFATRLLLSAVPDIDLSNKGYDARIELAVSTLMKRKGDTREQIRRYRHLIVDEIQDLVGIRAELVKALLEQISGGFTLLGDPAQAIYGFAEQVDYSGDPLIPWLRRRKWSPELQEGQLTTNYRSSGKMAILTERARGVVLREGPDIDAVLELQRLLSSLQSAGSGRDPGEDLLYSPYDSICILCRTNGELLQIASMLAKQGVDHHIRPKADEYALPAWLGRVLGMYPHFRMTMGTFQTRWDELVGEDELVDPEKAWYWLKRIDGRERRDLNVRELRRRLYRGYRLPDEADAGLYTGGSRLSLSTIHASKGREFDHVVLLEQSGSMLVQEKGANREEARVLYVASTRAREALNRFSRDGIPSRMWKAECQNGRQRWLAQTGSNYVFMEIGLGNDIDPVSHVSRYIHGSPSIAIQFQHLLWERARSGTRLYIHKYRQRSNTFFRIRFDESEEISNQDFAQTSLSFLADLREVLRQQMGGRFSYPSYWSTVRVSRVVTEVLPGEPDHIFAPFDESRFCIGIRVKGMVYIKGA